MFTPDAHLYLCLQEPKYRTRFNLEADIPRTPQHDTTELCIVPLVFVSDSEKASHHAPLLFPPRCDLVLPLNMELMTNLIGFALLFVCTGYGFVALAAQIPFKKHLRRAKPDHDHNEGVSILKPLHGDHPQLESCLRTFCTLNYPCYQLIFGVQDPDDPARAVAERLRDEYPNRDIQVIVASRSIGLNPKISNLAGMLPAAKYPWLVIADSDIVVEKNYLEHVAPPLASPEIGLVTCLYSGAPGLGRWNRVGALFINDWFAPSVCVAWAFGSRAFAFGATLALRRDVLEQIGGFEALADMLADDYRLGERIRQLGLEVRLADTLVATVVYEGTLSTLWKHEIRWLRTIRFVNPWGFAFSWVTLGIPLAMVGAILTGSPWAWWVLLVALVGRFMLHYQSARVLGSRSETVGLVVVRDFLTLGEWLCSLFSRRVIWHGQNLHVQAGDLLDEHPGESK